MLTPYLLDLAVVAALFVPTALLSACFVWYVRELAFRRQWVDVPDGERKHHERPTPAMGGIAIAAGALCGYGALVGACHVLGLDVYAPPPLFWVGAVLIVLTGFYDDLKGLGFKKKFAVQIVVAYLLVYDGFRVDLSAFAWLADADPYQLAMLSMPLTLLWIVGVMNAINLIDGLDGLAGGVVLIGFLSLSAIFGLNGEVGLTLLVIPVAGAIAGFLWHNFNPASIFMGDSGSLFLGYALAAYSLAGPAHADPTLAVLTPAVALGLPILDTAFSMVRRVRQQKSMFLPDHDHIHHRLAREGTVRSAVLRLYGLSTLVGLVAVAISTATTLVGYALIAVALGCALLLLAGLGYLRPGGYPLRPSIRLARRRRRASRPKPAVEADDTYAGGPAA